MSMPGASCHGVRAADATKSGEWLRRPELHAVIRRGAAIHNGGEEPHR
jgi:hypothetical protein